MKAKDDLLIKEKKHLKLVDACQNNIKISDMCLKDKFEKFEDNVLNESKTLLFEVENKIQNFNRFSRGSIVRVKFGTNVGSEFSGDHFAIVISKGDTMKNSVLHVIPITSKKHKKNIKIGDILYNHDLIDTLKNKIDSINSKYDDVCAISKNDKDIIKKINRVINYYSQRKGIDSYACIDHMKTISKLSVQKKMINDCDYLPKLKCSSELLKKIDEEIIKEYTV